MRHLFAFKARFVKVFEVSRAYEIKTVFFAK